MITAGVSVNCSLLLEPAHQLTFWLEKQHNCVAAPVRATLKLTNISATKPVVFKVRTNNAEMFTVKPVHGVVPPGDAVDVVISVVPSAAARLAAIDARELAARDTERFLIQSIERPEDMRGFDVSDLVAFWRRIPRELPVSSKVGCRFAVLPCDTDPRVLAVAARRLDTISMSPQPAVVVQQAPQPLEPLRRLSSPESPRGIDRTFDVRNADRTRRRNSSTTIEPEAFESSSSSDSDVSASPDDPTKSLPKKPAKALFSLHPSETLAFKVKPARPGRPAVLAPAAFFLTNRTRAHALAFKVKTTNHDGYFVKPSRGLIGPSNAQRIEVVPVKATSNNTGAGPIDTAVDLQQREAHDKFLVEIVRVDIANYQELLNLDERVRKRELFSLWDRADPGVREKAMMRCSIVGDVAAARSPPWKQQLAQAPVVSPPLQPQPYRASVVDNNSGDDELHDHDTWC